EARRRVHLEREPDVGVRQREGGEGLLGRARLTGGGAKEFPPGRRVEEERSYRDRGAALADRVGDAIETAAGDGELGAGLPIAGGEGEAGDRRDGGQRLAAEAERGHADEIGRAPDLAGGVAVEREPGGFGPHA